MLEFSLADGAPVFVNPDAIWHIRDSGAGSAAIYSHSGSALFVTGDAKAIALAWTEWKSSSPTVVGVRGLRLVADGD
jgi:hypothetical protein